MKIHLLPSEVVDQIAAGEVVERPSHLVKELVENSLDAGATLLEIEYDQGGRRVRITDNGSGMSADDLPLALARHATSKISVSDDLWKLGTFGFRGEALASIAAVSRLTLQSREKKAAEASKLLAEFGKIQKPESAGGNPGTTVLIEELFANLPARLKFLKSETAETSQIKTTLKALALANEKVEFRLKSKGKIENVWAKSSSFLERAKQILDVEKLYEVNSENPGFKVHIVFASPHEVAGNTRNIWLFVQGRWVQDRTLQAAVMEAYRGLLMHGEYPIVVVRLEANPEDIDVNIHPTKSQVKFKEQSAAFRAVHHCLRQGLEAAPWIEAPKATLSQGSFSQGIESGASTLGLHSARAESSAKGVSIVAAPTESELPGAAGSPELTRNLQFASQDFTKTQYQQKQDFIRAAPRSAPDDSPAFPSLKDLKNYAPTKEESLVSLPEEVASATGYWSSLQVLGQAHLTYIVAQADDKLVLVDQHAAHERVAYEKLMRDWKAGKAEVQNLLLPLTIEMEPEQVEALTTVATDLEKLGIQIDQMSPTTIAIRTQPLQIKDSGIVKSLELLSREMIEKGGSFALERKISDLCATMACHSVVRAGQALSHEQMGSLLRQMDEFPLSSFCPHGRPVSVDYPFAKLEKDFGRIV